MLLITDITVDREIEPCVKVDKTDVGGYAQAPERGDELPPVTVVHSFHGKWFADVIHHVATAKNA